MLILCGLMQFARRHFRFCRHRSIHSRLEADNSTQWHTLFNIVSSIIIIFSFHHQHHWLLLVPLLLCQWFGIFARFFFFSALLIRCLSTITNWLVIFAPKMSTEQKQRDDQQQAEQADHTTARPREEGNRRRRRRIDGSGIAIIFASNKTATVAMTLKISSVVVSGPASSCFSRPSNFNCGALVTIVGCQFLLFLFRSIPLIPLNEYCLDSRRCRRWPFGGG